MRNGAINSFDSKKSLDTRNKSTSKRFCRVLPPYDLLPRKTNMRLLLFHMLERATSLQSSKNSHFLSAAKFLESWEKFCVSAARSTRHNSKEAQTQHSNAQIEHIHFLHDGLEYEFAKSIVCQTGEKARGPWHVYANPHEPWLCPVLELARYVLCYQEFLCGGYRRYNTRFANLVSECSAS